MADQVQASLDRMVPALRELLDRGIFTESEIKAIVSRRRESEYLLRRMTPRKADYQRYIEAEKNLEKLRSLRKKMVMARQKAKEREDAAEDKNSKGDKDSDAKGKSNNNNSIGDASIVQNIHLLYVRAKRKWKEDLAWHMQHAEFAKQAKSYQMLSRIYAEALQIHPRNESLWIEAASHEYFGYITNEKDEGMSGGGSIKSARVLLQRGLRINASSKKLWLQYFCLELHYIQKLRGRREILRLKVAANKDGSKDQDVDEDSRGCDGDDDYVGAEINESVKLPLIIYKNAVKSIPNDISFRMQFIEQSKLFPETQSLVNHIMKTVESDFENMEDAWIARACFVIENQSSEDPKKTGFFLTNESNSEDNDSMRRKRKITEISGDKNNVPDDRLIKILREAMDTVQSPKMLLESLSLLRKYISKLSSSLEEEDDEEENDDVNEKVDATRKIISKMIQFIVQLINEAESKITVSPELAIEMATCLLELGLLSQSLKLLKRLTDENPECRKDPNCWLKIVDISELNNGSLVSSSRILRRALKFIPLHDPGHRDILSRMFMNLLTISSKESDDEELSSTYEKILLLSSNNAEQSRISIPAISLAFLNYASTKNDIKLIRKVYKNLLYNSSYCQLAFTSTEDVENMKNFFDECLAIEKEEIKMSRSNQSSKKRCKHILTGLLDAAFKYFINIDDNLAHSYQQRGSELF